MNSGMGASSRFEVWGTSNLKLRVARLSLVSLVALAGCSSTPDMLVLSGDRQLVREADGSYHISEVWLQERYQLERALRLRLERCEVTATAEGSTK